MSKMNQTDKKKCKIYPKKYSSIPDILPKNKVITEDTEMELNPREIQRAMATASVSVKGSDGKEVFLNEKTFNDAVEVSNTEDPKNEQEDSDTPDTSDTMEEDTVENETV